MRICTSTPKSTERGSLIVSFDALTGLFIAMGLVLRNIAQYQAHRNEQPCQDIEANDEGTVLR